MREALEGKPVDPEQPIPWDRRRDWLLVKLTGWTFDEIDAQPAARTEWLLALEKEFGHG